MSGADHRGVLVGRRTVLAGGGALAGMLLVGCSRAADDRASDTADGMEAKQSEAARPMMVVHKDPNCGCCQSWADIAQRAGYPVEIVNETDLAAVKARLGVPEELASCHTTEVGGLVAEGHVPLAAVERMLRERPAGIRGIAVPGMPAGSPGMEMPDGQTEPFQVFAFFADGRASIFAA